MSSSLPPSLHNIKKINEKNSNNILLITILWVFLCLGVRPVHLPLHKLVYSTNLICLNNSLEALILKGVGNVQQVYCVIFIFFSIINLKCFFMFISSWNFYSFLICLERDAESKQLPKTMNDQSVTVSVKFCLVVWKSASLDVT